MILNITPKERGQEDTKGTRIKNLIKNFVNLCV
jgi:hypothetical protein